MTVLQTEQQTINDQVNDLSVLNLPPVWQSKIGQIIQENHMLYEARMETADNYNELRERLKGRGFTNVPMGAIPLLHMQAYKKAPVANTSSCKIRKTMIRKRKR